MKCVAIIAKRDPAVWLYVVDVDSFIDVDNKLALWMNLVRKKEERNAEAELKVFILDRLTSNRF